MDYSAIKEIRKQYGISQTKLAEYSGYTKQLISKWELEKEYPSDEQIKKLEGVLNDLIPKIESGEINLKGHRLVSTQKKSSKNRSYIKDAEDYAERCAGMSYDSEYSKILTKLYFDAKGSNDTKKYKGIGLFSGCGGLDLGFEAAGVEIIGHVEIWDAANKIYEQNFPNSKLLKEDINDVTDSDIRAWQEEFGSIDIIVGGPPCQGFSLAGKRDPEDLRNQLYKQYVRIVDGLRPKVFVFENVAKMTSMRNKDGRLFLDEILCDFSEVGYSLVYKTVNACQYGVPQSRERVLLVGIRTDINKTFSFNEPKFSSDGSSLQVSLFEDKPRIRSFRYATEDLELLEHGEASEKDPLHWAITHPEHIIDWLKDVPEGQSAHDNPDPSKRPPSGFNTTYKRIVWDEPCSTISTNFNMISGCRNVHPSCTRSFTVREATRAQSFPDEFVFCGKWGDVRKAIGNAVPPILAYELAREIIEQIL